MPDVVLPTSALRDLQYTLQSEISDSIVLHLIKRAKLPSLLEIISFLLLLVPFLVSFILVKVHLLRSVFPS